MSVLHLSRLAVILVPAACALAACMGSHDTPEPAGDSGSSGSSTGAGGAGGNKSYFGNTAATTGAGADTTQNCGGDAGAWSQLTEGPISCQSGEECCVIMSPCLGDAQIVAAEHMKEAIEVWPSCPTKCNDCVARPIEVACISGSCLGRIIVTAAPEPWDSPLRQDHCGTALQFTEPSPGKTGVHFWPFACGPQGGTEGGPDGGPSGPDGGSNSGPDGGH